MHRMYKNDFHTTTINNGLNDNIKLQRWENNAPIKA